MLNQVNEVYLLALTYDINFRDADEGDCYAGEGCKVLSAHLHRESAEAIASEFNPIFAQAEKEVIVFPVQKFNQVLKHKFGFTCNSIDNGYNFKLSVEPLTVEV